MNGELPSGWTVENLYNSHSSHPHNPDIANAFFQAGLIESWGRGIERMINACEVHGISKPEIRYEMGGIWLIFYFIESGGQIGGQKNIVIDLTERQKEIIKIITEDEQISRKALSRALGINESAIQKHLTRLKELGVLQRVGGTRGYWKITR